jgi:hypothetical protein
MHVKLAPPTHTLPSMKRIDRIPSRPMAAPWEASYDGGACPRVDEPLGDARVDAPANGIFANTDRQREGPHLELLGGSFGTPTNNPEHELTHAGIVRFEGEDVRGARQTDCSPTRSVVNPVVIEDVTAVDSQSSGDAIEVVVIQRPCSAQCWAAEG